MAFCIITNGSNTNHLFSNIKQCIENGILGVNGDYKYIDLNEFDFRRCTGDRCVELEFDIYSAFGCKRSNECIKEHNKEETEKIYGSLLDCGNIIFLLDTESKDSKNKFHIFAEGLREKIYSEEKAKRLFFQKKALYVVVDNKSYSRYDAMSGILELIKRFGIKCIDTFSVNKGNVDYMLDVLEVAVPALNKCM